MSQLDPAQNHCWRTIGIWGDHSCSELKTWIHCYNCPVLGEGGRHLFEQAPPAGYLEEWGGFLATQQEETLQTNESALIFALGKEWFGLSTRFFSSVEEHQSIRRIPHRSNRLLVGVVNIRGGLQLCISLAAIVDATGSADDLKNFTSKGPKLAFIEKNGERWVFPMDSILGVHRFHSTEIQPPPVTVARSPVPLVKGLLTIQDKTAGILDDELLFFHLKRTVLS